MGRAALALLAVLSAAPAAAQLPTPTPTTTPGPCVGDCDGNGTVVIGELVRMVSCALSTNPICACAGQPEICIATLVLAVTHALLGCSAPTPVPIERLILNEAAVALDCPYNRDVSGFDCELPGHRTTAALIRHANPTAARAALDAQRGDVPLQWFHGYAAASWEYDERPGETLPFHHRFHTWVAGEFVVGVHSFDDTTYRLAYDPLAVSEAIYRRAVFHGLIPHGEACRTSSDCGAGYERCVEPGGSLGCGYCELHAEDECASDGDCGDGEICRLTTATDCGVPCFGAVLRCFPGCTADADCDGRLCGADHRCAPRPCAADGDCPEHFACGGGQCDRISCVADEECGSGFCVLSQCRDRLGTSQVLPA